MTQQELYRQTYGGIEYKVKYDYNTLFLYKNDVQVGKKSFYELFNE